MRFVRLVMTDTQFAELTSLLQSCNYPVARHSAVGEALEALDRREMYDVPDMPPAESEQAEDDDHEGEFHPVSDLPVDLGAEADDELGRHAT